MKWSILALFLCAVTSSLAAAQPKSVTPEKPASRQIRLISYNIWGLPFASKEYTKRMRQLPKALTDLKADILCLQEVWTGSVADRIRGKLGDGYLRTEGNRGGLVTLSRFKILETTFIPFGTHEGLSLVERIANKGHLLTTIETPAGVVSVLNSHLAIQASNEARTDQFKKLAAYTSKLTKRPMVLAADLNTRPTNGEALSPKFKWLIDQGFKDVKPPVMTKKKLLDCGPPTRVGWPRLDARWGWHPDHILFRSTTALKLELTRYRMKLDDAKTALSDHNLLLADFRITPQQKK